MAHKFLHNKQMSNRKIDESPSVMNTDDIKFDKLNSAPKLDTLPSSLVISKSGFKSKFSSRSFSNCDTNDAAYADEAAMQKNTSSSNLDCDVPGETLATFPREYDNRISSDASAMDRLVNKETNGYEFEGEIDHFDTEMDYENSTTYGTRGRGQSQSLKGRGRGANTAGNSYKVTFFDSENIRIVTTRDPVCKHT